MLKWLSTPLLLLGLWCITQDEGLSATFGYHYLTNTTVGTTFKYDYAEGDTWYSTWADDGNIYATTNDIAGCNFTSCSGTSNVAIFQLSGYTSGLTGTEVNAMASWGTQSETGSDSATYKSTGIISVNGTLYVPTSRQVYNSSTPPFLQTAANAQIIKSSNHGSSWTPTPPSTAQPYASPMFTNAKFSTPSFIQYGQDYQGNTVDNSGTYVYAISNDGFWNNGNHLYLGRVLISAIGNLSASDWSFWQGGDGMQSGNWGAISTAASLIDNPLRLGIAAVQYMPALGLYAMYEWYYPSVAASAALMDTTTVEWDLYTAPHPWGPWTFVLETTSNPAGLYNPVPVSKSVSGGDFTVFAAGNFRNVGQTGDYNLTLAPITLN